MIINEIVFLNEPAHLKIFWNCSKKKKKSLHNKKRHQKRHKEVDNHRNFFKKIKVDSI